MGCGCEDNQMGELLVDENPFLYDHPHYEDPMPVFDVGSGSSPVQDSIEGEKKTNPWLIVIPIAIFAYLIGKGGR